jgi:hypothetical protein
VVGKERGARLPLSAETGDISRVERFRWIVLEAAAGKAIYRPVLRKKPGIYGGLMDFSSRVPVYGISKRKCFVKQGLQPSTFRGASSNSHKLPDVTVSGVAGAPYFRLISRVSGSTTAGS